jgi:hypothetical protein
MKASTYKRKHKGDLPDAILKALMTDHGCIHHAGANSGACLTCIRRTDIVMTVFKKESE